MEKVNVLFVCTGNIFRSMIAEHVMKKYLKDNKINNIKVSSAGTVADFQIMDSFLFNAMKNKRINPSKHKQRRLNEKILKDNDIIISMADYHQDFIMKNFNKDSHLFNELALGKNTSVWDGNDVIENWKTNKKALDKHMLKTLDHIYNNMPALVNQVIKRNLLFSYFVHGAKKHIDGHPFRPLIETKNCIAFLSINIPKKEDAHILIIPKKRYMYLDDVPDGVLSEMMRLVKIIAKALKLRHPAYNILINVGKSAGQWQNHVHFHIIPRKPNDDIKIEVWKGKKLSNKQFLKYHKQILSDIKKVKSHKI